MGFEVLQLGPATEGRTLSSLPHLRYHTGLHPTEAEAKGHTSSLTLHTAGPLPQEHEK